MILEQRIPRLEKTESLFNVDKLSLFAQIELIL
jgi:hypothetical protein